MATRHRHSSGRGRRQSGHGARPRLAAAHDHAVAPGIPGRSSQSQRRSRHSAPASLQRPPDVHADDGGSAEPDLRRHFPFRADGNNARVWGACTTQHGRHQRCHGRGHRGLRRSECDAAARQGGERGRWRPSRWRKRTERSDGPGRRPSPGPSEATVRPTRRLGIGLACGGRQASAASAEIHRQPKASSDRASDGVHAPPGNLLAEAAAPRRAHAAHAFGPSEATVRPRAPGNWARLRRPPGLRRERGNTQAAQRKFQAPTVFGPRRRCPRAAWELGSLAEAVRPPRRARKFTGGPTIFATRRRWAAQELGSLAEAARPPRRARKFTGGPTIFANAKMVGRLLGIEPRTNRLKGECSTTELAARDLLRLIPPLSGPVRQPLPACGCALAGAWARRGGAAPGAAAHEV